MHPIETKSSAPVEEIATPPIARASSSVRDPYGEQAAQASSVGDARGLATGAPRSVIKVLQVIDTLDIGGTEAQIVQVTMRLASPQCQVTVACLHQGGRLRAVLESAGIRVVDFPKTGSIISVSGTYQLLRLSQFIRREKFDVVHSHDLWANLMAVPAAKLAGAPMVLSSQRDLAHLWWYTPFRTKIIRRLHRWSNFVTANSTAVRNLLVDDFHIPKDRVCVIRNGVNLDRLVEGSGDRQKLLPGIDPKSPLVITVANMHSRVKGHYELIQAARIIRDAFPTVKFLIAGDGEERPGIERAAHESGVGDMFVFLGQRSDVSELLSCCDLFVLPSLAEGLPNAILEAMASGLPIVATRVGGIPEIIEDGRSGVMVAPKDPKALAGAIMRVLGDANFAATIAQSGQERVRAEFSFQRALESLRQLYTSSV